MIASSQPTLLNLIPTSLPQQPQVLRLRQAWCPRQAPRSEGRDNLLGLHFPLRTLVTLKACPTGMASVPRAISMHGRWPRWQVALKIIVASAASNQCR
jgi:hypothetical protein